jgi:REP element-mobilizing transposase RayT
MLKVSYRRKLPHLQRDRKPHFVTFCTYDRWALLEDARSIVLSCCLHDNGSRMYLHAVAVMRDHVHMIFIPMVNEEDEQKTQLSGDDYGQD